MLVYDQKTLADQEKTVQMIEDKDIDPESKLHKGFRKNTDFGKEGSDAPGLDQFYFRLSGRNLYYTKNDKDMIVLGAINIRNLDAVNN